MKNTTKKFLTLISVVFVCIFIGAMTASAAEEISPEAGVSCEMSGHSYEAMFEPATLEAPGKSYSLCINCFDMVDLKENIVAKIATVKLSTSKCTYNGKERKPSVTVKDVDGKSLVAGQDYDVIYPDGMKLPGKYEITVSFKGNYTGEKKLIFTIAPKATTGVKVKTQSTSSITLSWSKTTGATGYRIYQYSSGQGKYVVKASIKDLTTYKVTGLKAGTTYKFKIKPYVKSEDGTVIWGNASSVCSAKTGISYSVNISASTATIYVGATKTLKATSTPSSKTVTWKSSDKLIAKVSADGKVTAVTKGTATITAYFKVDGKTYKDTCKVTVKVPFVTMNRTSLAMSKGETFILQAIASPSDLPITWKSSNTSVAAVSSSGKVTAKKTGTATITASTTYKGATYKKTCKITVVDASAEENFASLISYIKANGKYDNYGYKCIKKSFKDDEYIYNFEMTYNTYMGGVCFYMTTDSIYGEEIESAIDMYYYNADKVNFQAILSSYDYRGDLLYGSWATGGMNPSNYINAYNVFNDWTNNSFPNKQVAPDFSAYSLEVAMEVWDQMVYDAIGVGLVGLGFTHYSG